MSDRLIITEDLYTYTYIYIYIYLYQAKDKLPEYMPVVGVHWEICSIWRKTHCRDSAGLRKAKIAS